MRRNTRPVHSEDEVRGDGGKQTVGRRRAADGDGDRRMERAADDQTVARKKRKRRAKEEPEREREREDAIIREGKEWAGKGRGR